MLFRSARQPPSDDELVAAVAQLLGAHQAPTREPSLANFRDFLDFTREVVTEAGLDEESAAKIYEAAARVFLARIATRDVTLSLTHIPWQPSEVRDRGALLFRNWYEHSK